MLIQIAQDIEWHRDFYGRAHYVSFHVHARRSLGAILCLALFGSACGALLRAGWNRYLSAAGESGLEAGVAQGSAYDADLGQSAPPSTTRARERFRRVSSREA